MRTNWKEIVSRSAMLALGGICLASGAGLILVVSKYLADPDTSDPEGSGLCCLLGFALLLTGGYLAFSALRLPPKHNH